MLAWPPLAAGPNLTTRPYPWHALPAVPREAALALRETRRSVRRAIREERIAEALAELIGERVYIEVLRVEVTARGPSSLPGAHIVLGTADAAIEIELELDANLARTLVARVLGRPSSAIPAPPPVLEIEGGVRGHGLGDRQRAHGGGPTLLPIATGNLRTAPGERSIDVHATLKLGAEAYGVRARVITRSLAPYHEPATSALASLGKTPIAVRAIVAVSMGGSLRARDAGARRHLVARRGMEPAPRRRPKCARGRERKCALECARGSGAEPVSACGDRALGSPHERAGGSL